MHSVDNFNNEPLNKYKKKSEKWKKKFIDLFFYLSIDDHSNFIQFHYHLIVHQKLSNFHTIWNGFNLTVFDGLTNDNKIVWNLNDHQSKGRITHIIFFIFI
jgi:hypothetical protein